MNQFTPSPPLVVRGLPTDPQTQVGWYGSVSQVLSQQGRGAEAERGHPYLPNLALGLRGTDDERCPSRRRLSVPGCRAFDSPDEETDADAPNAPQTRMERGRRNGS